MNKYSSYSDAQLEELFSYYLIDSWNYSKVASFSRNEKEFEKTYIYRERSKMSATTISGSGYHKSLEQFFCHLIDGIEDSLIDLERIAFKYIDEVPFDTWKIQKTTPTVEECRIKATKSVSSLLRYFYEERSVYLSDISEIVAVEMRCNEWLLINGVDIPLPCHAVIDLVVRLTDGRTVIIDHKTKSKYTDEDELALVCGKQAITYIKCYESRTREKVDEVWFIENKDSKNKDGSPQLKKLKIILDDDTRKLYEALLYEPLKRMVDAVSDPDYVYMINDNDNFVDRAELYEFWAKTMIAEVDDFSIPEKKKKLISRRLKKIRDASLTAISPKAIASFRENAASFITYDFNNNNMTNGEKIEHVLRVFGVSVRVAHEIQGYSSDTFLLEISAGTKISNILKYRLDIANALNVASVRMGSDLMVYNDRSYLFIESPKKRTDTLLWNKKYLDGERLPIGVDNFGRTVYWDLNNNSTPHMLICGATGSGKSVSIISTVEYAKAAGISNIVIFDPKYEFTSFSGKRIRVFNEVADIELQMEKLVADMQQRAKTGKSQKILIVFDEFADAVTQCRKGPELDIKEEVITGFTATGKPKVEIRVIGRKKSLEENLKALLQKGRSLGFRVIAATQRASTEIITGDAKVNLPVQICFRVPKELDSRVVIDEAGAETLGGSGDGLMKSPEYLNVIRFQGFYKT